MSLLRAARLWALRVAILTYWACRPRLPWAIAEPIVRRRIARAQRSEKAMAYARGQMENLLAATDQASAIEEKAAAFLAFDMTASEMRWNPRKLNQLRLVGIENLIHARSLGRGGSDNTRNREYVSGWHAGGADYEILVFRAR